MKTKIFICAILTAIVMLVGACANVTIRKIPNIYNSNGEKKVDAKISGIRFYRPAPYLWVTPSEDDSIKALKFEIIWLPNYSEEYIVQWKPGLGTVKPKITLTNGWNMVSFDAEIDSKAAENLTAIASVATAAATLDFNTGGSAVQAAGLAPGLYRLKPNQDGVLTLGELVVRIIQ